MSKYEVEKKKLQDNLSLIRNAGGWSTREFGEMIGVTKQTISNMENHKTDMTVTQYIAIRAVLEYEIKEHPDNELLASTFNLCMNTDKITDDDREKVQAFVSGAKKSGLDNAAIFAGMAALIGVAVADLAVPIIPIAGAWLATVLTRKKK